MHKRIHKEENVQFTKRKDLILLMVSELDHRGKARGRDSCRKHESPHVCLLSRQEGSLDQV